MFEAAEYEKAMGVDLPEIKQRWDIKVKEIFEEARLPVPEKIFMHKGGKAGRHTEQLGYILAELQYMQRTYPNVEW